MVYRFRIVDHVHEETVAGHFLQRGERTEDGLHHRSAGFSSFHHFSGKFNLLAIGALDGGNGFQGIVVRRALDGEIFNNRFPVGVAVNGNLVAEVLGAVQAERHHFDIIEIIFLCKGSLCFCQGNGVLVKFGKVHPGTDRYMVYRLAGQGGSDSFFSIHKVSPFRNNYIHFFDYTIGR